MNMNMNYYEIYVGEPNGFSTYVKTDSEIKNSILDEVILQLAVDVKIIDGGDAKSISQGNGYIEKLDFDEVCEAVNGDLTRINLI